MASSSDSVESSGRANVDSNGVSSSSREGDEAFEDEAGYERNSRSSHEGGALSEEEMEYGLDRVSTSSSGTDAAFEQEADYNRMSTSRRSLEESQEVTSSRESDDHDELTSWTAWESLPLYNRLRTTVIKSADQNKETFKKIDVREWGRVENRAFLDRNLGGAEDNGVFLRKIRDRLDKVNVILPTIEVRFENLTLQTEIAVHRDGYGLPNLKNSAIKGVDSVLRAMPFNLSVIKKQPLTILRGISGILKPRRMSLLLGPPGSGRTSLLLALSASLGQGVKQEGKITYNGFTFDEFEPLNTSAYVGQNDLHAEQFTVRETLDDAAKYQGVGTKYDLIAELVKREAEIGVHPDPDVDYFMKRVALEDCSHDFMAAYIIKILGLDSCSDQTIGNELIRGISGGERKRVTIGEMLVGPSRALFMDEVTNGLDSFRALQTIRCLKQFVHILDMTVFITLLQPAPEIFNLFDDIILLAEGQIVYQGPREHVEEFFESCGFRCPSRKAVADFLQEVTSRKDQEQYWFDKSKVYEYVPVEQFSKAHMEFHTGVKLMEEMATPYDKSKCHKAALAKHQWQRSRKDLFTITLQREIRYLRRISFLYFFKTTQTCIQGIILASVFFHTRMHRRNLSDARTFAGALFATLTMIIFSGFSDVTLTVVRLPIFYKLREMRMIPGWAFALSVLITRIPISVMEAVVFASITYYPMNFAPNAGRFFRTILVYATGHLMTSTVFRLIAGATRTIIVANSVGSMVLVLVFMLGGYLIPRPQQKSWWIWGYWSTPFTWCLTAVFENEFLSPQWNVTSQNGRTNLGRRFLHLFGYYPHGYWYWISIGAIVSMALSFALLLVVVLSYVPAPRMSDFALSDDTLAKLKVNRSWRQPKAKESSVTSTHQLAGTSGSLDNETENDREQQEENQSQDAGRTHLSPSNSPGISLESQAEFENMPARRGMVLPFQPLAITFRNISYSIEMPPELQKNEAHAGSQQSLELLHDITGVFRPGILTALVGVSGAGKSTLMDVLCGRKTRGKIEGDIRISGFPKNQRTFTRISGYCEQVDVHSPQLTVHESITFSAWLRLPSEIDRQTKEKFVEEVLNLVELTNLRNAIVGLPATYGLSTAQRKLLSIAVELVANPSIIFLDEPTTGLDARAAAIVMRAIRNTVDTGRTVVCTIHQPSIDIFESFDELLLLKMGGHAIYAGSLGVKSQDMVRYFQGIPGIPELKTGENPAAWMLEVTTDAMEKRLGISFAQMYRDSPVNEQNKAMVDELSESPPGAEVLFSRTQLAPTYPQQLLLILWRQSITYWRAAHYNNVRYVFTILFALFFGSIYFHDGKQRGSYQDVVLVAGSTYAAGLLLGILMTITLQPLVSTERGVFYRERGAGMYGPIAYTSAQILIEIPYTLVQAIIYSLITYAAINLEWKADKFLLYLHYNFCIILSFCYIGMLGVGLTPTVDFGAVVVSFWIGIWNIFSGIIIARPVAPKWWQWYFWANPLAWHVYGTIVSQFGDLNDVLTNVEIFDPQLGIIFVRESIPAYLKAALGFRHKLLGLTVVISALFPVIFATGYMVAMKYVNFQKR